MQKERKEKERKIIEATKNYRTLLPKCGSRKLHKMLKGNNEEIVKGFGRDKYYGLLKERGLLAKRKRRTKYQYTTAESQKDIKNMKKELTVERRNQLIESDITILYTRREQLALALCLDVYSRKILGWHLSRRMRSEEAIKALRMSTVGKEEEFLGGIHHSDQGTQYGSKEYKEAVRSLGMKVSMSKRGTPTEAAYIERVNNTLKNELNLKRYFVNYEQAEKEVMLAILIYNNVRPHLSLGYKTPSKVYDGGELNNKITPFGLRPQGVIL